MFKIRILNSEISSLSLSIRNKFNRGLSGGLDDAADYMIAQAGLISPVLTGRLARSFRKRHISGGRRVYTETVSDTGFPYPKWINQEQGYVTLTGYYSFIHPLSGTRVTGNQPRTYGSSPSHWTWRGMPRFWDISVENTRRKFPDMIIRQLRNEGAIQ